MPPRQLRAALARFAVAAIATGSFAALAASSEGAMHAMPAPAASNPSARSAALNEAEKARLVLDRLAFGARPGDVEKVRAMGVDAWIARQLRPDSIQDADVERRVAGLKVPKMSTAELFAKYPNPAMLLRAAGKGKGKAAAAQGQDEGEADRKQVKRELVREYREK
ncbi:MAG: DUF1800 family protein, partial [Arenimonas sp.]